MIDKLYETTCEGIHVDPARHCEEPLTYNIYSDYSFPVPPGPVVLKPVSDTPPKSNSTGSRSEAYSEWVAKSAPVTVIDTEFTFVLGAEGFDSCEWPVEGDLPKPPADQSRQERYAAVIALLEKWVAEDLGDDQESWNRLKRGIDESRTSSRKRFRD